MNGRATGIFGDGVRGVVHRYGGREFARVVRRVARARDAQLASSGAAGTLGYHVGLVALSTGMAEGEARALAALVDVLDLAVDLADNLADWEDDRAARRTLQRHYRGLPRAVLECVPALLLAAATTELHRAFPAPRYDAPHAVGRLLRALAAAAVGQGKPDGSRARIDAIAGQQGRLFALPLWLDARRDQTLTQQVEAWGVQVGRASHHCGEAAARPTDRALAARARRAQARAEGLRPRRWTRPPLLRRAGP